AVDQAFGAEDAAGNAIELTGLTIGGAEPYPVADLVLEAMKLGRVVVDKGLRTHRHNEPDFALPDILVIGTVGQDDAADRLLGAPIDGNEHLVEIDKALGNLADLIQQFLLGVLGMHHLHAGANAEAG